MVPAVFLVAAAFPLVVWATYPHTQPCHGGSCRWEHADDYGYGRFDLTGPVSSISDLTPSAGWTILDCDPSASDQDIRLVCHDPSKGCDHLYLNGAHHTIVRLPDECGSTAFAYVKDEWVHENQNIRGRKRHTLRRDGAQPIVKGLTLSTKYSQLDHTRHGEVSFNGFGFSGSTLADESSSCLPHLHGFKLEVDCVNTTVPQPFNYTNTEHLFDKSIDCPQQGSVPGYAADISADITTSINGSALFGWSLVGTPSEAAKNLKFYFGVNTTIGGTLDLSANLNGTLSSGKREIANIELTPMGYIPGILQIGPYFKVSAEADATLNANIDLSIDLAYALTDANLYFPDKIVNGSGFNIDDSSSGLQLSASPSAAVEGKVSVHLIPSLSLEFNLFHIIETSVNLDLDASAALDMTLHAGVDASTSTDGSSGAGATAEWGGCVNATTSLNLDMNADADLPPLYSKDDTMPLWGYTWPLYSTCFNGSAPIGRRAYIDQGDEMMWSYRDRVLNRYMKNVTPANSAATSIPSGCGSIGKGSLLPVVPKKATSSH